MSEEKAIARPFTLRDMLAMSNNQDVTVVNEVNETLVSLTEIQFYVNNPTKVLKDELLDREVMGYMVEAGDLLIKVKGEEDAE
jgi:uncharacterized protein (UPF0218 family)